MDLTHNIDHFFFLLHKNFYNIFISSLVLFLVILFFFYKKCHTQYFLHSFMLVCDFLFPLLAGDKRVPLSSPQTLLILPPPHTVWWWWFSHQVVSNFCNPWTVACQAPLSMGFSRPESWSGLLVPSPGDLLSPGLGPRLPTLQAESLPAEL